MGKNTKENKEKKVNNENNNLKIEKFLNIWIAISVIAMCTSTVYVFNICMIVANVIIFMIANFKRLNYKRNEELVDEGLKREYFGYVVLSKIAILLIVFGIGGIGFGYKNNITLNYYITLSILYSVLVVLPIVKSFKKRVLLIEEYNVNKVDDLFYSYLTIAMFGMICGVLAGEGIKNSLI